MSSYELFENRKRTAANGTTIIVAGNIARQSVSGGVGLTECTRIFVFIPRYEEKSYLSPVFTFHLNFTCTTDENHTAD